ncbi:hypothetical protein ACQKGL_02085 [Ensifer adhaerens]|uniref:hypothetical protein n=1 Tax=Ensifer adhaerens TaxID=106592 RepID=UPI003CFC28D3
MDFKPLLAAILSSKIEELNNPDFCHPEPEMKELLAARYNAYVDDLRIQHVPYEHLSERGKSWSDQMDQLLGDTQKALNLGHAALGKATANQRRRAEELQSRAEDLIQQFGDNIEATPDEPFFQVQHDVTDDYYDAQTLIEHWELPRVKKTDHAGMTPTQYRNQIQNRYLTALLSECEPTTATPPAPRNETIKAKLERLRRYAE